MKNYHSIAVQWEKGDPYTLQFGDYDAEVVRQEAEDSYGDAYKVRIIHTGDTTESINAFLKNLNGEKI